MAKSSGRPTCSFCGAHDGRRYMAGPHHRTICQACVEQPRLDDPVKASSACAFCNRRIGERRRWWQSERVEAVTARSGLVLCHLCQALALEVFADAPAVEPMSPG